MAIFFNSVTMVKFLTNYRKLIRFNLVIKNEIKKLKGFVHMIKKRFSFLIAALFCFAVTACDHQSQHQSANKDSNSSNTTEEETISVGVDTTFPPFETIQNGKPTGFDVDLVNAIAEKENLKIKYQTMQFNGIIPALQTGVIKLGIAGISITPERMKAINFSNPYYLSGLSFISNNEVDEQINDDNVQNILAGKTIATRKGTSSALYLQNIPGIGSVKSFEQIVDAYNLLAAGGADYVLFDNPVNLSTLNTHPNYHIASVLLQGQYYGIAVSKKAPEELLKKINDGLEKIQQDGTYDKIYAKYFGDHLEGKVKEKIDMNDVFSHPAN